MKLLLFDIDGTILHTNGAGREAMTAALTALFGPDFGTEGVAFGGKTDPQIIHELLAANGVPKAEAEAEACYEALMETYMAHMHRHLSPAAVTLCPGIDTLIPTLADTPGVQLGLLTGNVEPMAYLKLAAVGLDAFFPFGAFGSDHAERSALPAVAVERAHRHLGRRFVGADVVIIGDTENDILCGRGIGARSVAVCTGSYPREALRSHAPDLLFDDLTDHDLFLQSVLA